MTDDKNQEQGQGGGSDSSEDAVITPPENVEVTRDGSSGSGRRNS